MKSLAFVLLAIAGCDADDHDTFDVEPASTDTPLPPNGITLRGRICISNSLSNLTVCRTTALAGFTVSIGDRSTTTDDNGDFTIPMPTGSQLSFTVRGIGAVTTTMPFSPSLTLPVIDADVFARSMASNQIFLAPNQGTILGTVTRDGVPVRGVAVSSIPTSAFSPLFDATDVELGTATGTGARGVFLVPGLTFGAASLQLADTTGAETTVAGVQVVNGGVTILDSIPL